MIKHDRKDADNPIPIAVKAAEAAKLILIAEDDEEMRVLLEHRLRKENYEVESCGDGFELLEHIGSFTSDDPPKRFDLIVSDIRMPGFTGLEILDFIHANGGFPPTVLITAFGDEQTHAEAERLGVAAVLDKPFDLDQLAAVVHRILSAAGQQPERWQRARVEHDDRERAFPLEVIFRRYPHLPETEQSIDSVARVLNQFRSDILYGRVVVTSNNRVGDAGGFDLRGIIIVPGKVFVASTSRPAGSQSSDVRSAATEIFAILEGRLRKHYEKFPPARNRAEENR